MEISVFIGLLTKHFVCDFPLQVPFHYKNKGTYGHVGGIQHAAIHGIGTAFVLIFFTTPWMVTLLAFLDMVIHYHVDWAKMNINSRFGLRPDNSEKFWWLLGLDQYLHGLTYVFILWILK